ncbi:MAG: class I SAM-dependent methyltransferase, partial [Hydrogenophaga sp.]|nr:class I SAM-dependent methyltransferase [Hydrogenophaga sp.]
MLIEGMESEASGFSISEDLISQVLRQEMIADEESNRAQIRDIFARNFRLTDLFLTAENNFYLQRIGLKVEGYRAQADVLDHGSLVCELASHMIPRTLPPSELRSWNVRLNNLGQRTLHCQGASAAFLTYRLVDANGQEVAVEAEKTSLPVDIPSGRGITVPLWLQPPAQPGLYTVEVRLELADGSWSSAPLLSVELDVRPDWSSSVPAHWLNLHRLPGTYDYQIDHEIGRVFLKEEMALLGRPLERVLEIGGCCNPMTWDLPCPVVSADIDVQTLQVGALRFSTYRPNVEFVAADAHRLPFADGVFDCAVMFATLHHFLDPAACLKELMRTVRQDGFVAILCEPIGSYRAEGLSNEFKADLEQGINEQIFTPEEYGQIFARAGIQATRAVIDGGSFKAILRRLPEPVPP